MTDPIPSLRLDGFLPYRAAISVAEWRVLVHLTPRRSVVVWRRNMNRNTGSASRNGVCLFT